MFKAKIKQSMEVDKHPSFEKYSHLPVTLKLYIAKEFYPELYTEIFDAVKELFMEVNDIDIVEDSIREVYMVAIEVYCQLDDVVTNTVGMLIGWGIWKLLSSVGIAENPLF